MSFNDRCGEALEILKHGGTLPDQEARDLLIELLARARDGRRASRWGELRMLAYAVRRHPDNQELLRQTSDGEWIGD